MELHKCIGSPYITDSIFKNTFTAQGDELHIVQTGDIFACISTYDQKVCVKSFFDEAALVFKAEYFGGIRSCSLNGL